MYTEGKNGGESDVVQTAWALLALISAGYHRVNRKPIDAGIRVLIRKQLPSGDFPQEGITGVFNKTCKITYSKNRCLPWARHHKNKENFRIAKYNIS